MRKTKAIMAGMALLALPAFASAAVVFSDGMSSGAAWTVNGSADAAATFGYDYSADGIPAAPSGGDTIGLKMEANLADGVAAEIVATPSSLVLTGSHRVTFDLWTNFEFGAGSSTEFAGGGLGYDGTTPGRNGGTLLVTGDGGSSRDFRGYKDTGEQFPASGQYLAGTASGDNNGSAAYYHGVFPGGDAAPAVQSQVGTTDPGDGGFRWHTWTITALNNSSHNFVQVAIDGLPIVSLDANIGSSFATEGQVSLVYADLFSSLNTSGLNFGIYDNITVEDVPEPASFALLALGSMALLRRRR
jgi:hypothetical protein